MSAVTPSGQVQKIARDIADDLFTDGYGERAHRLVLENGAKFDIGGWSWEAVRDRAAAIIARHLLDALDGPARLIDELRESAGNTAGGRSTRAGAVIPLDSEAMKAENTKAGQRAAD